MVAMLIGCGLRRAELLALQIESIQQREEYWVIADLVGRNGHMRTVPIPIWVKVHVDSWTAAAGITPRGSDRHAQKRLTKASASFGGIARRGPAALRPDAVAIGFGTSNGAGDFQSPVCEGPRVCRRAGL